MGKLTWPVASRQLRPRSKPGKSIRTQIYLQGLTIFLLFLLLALIFLMSTYRLLFQGELTVAGQRGLERLRTAALVIESQHDPYASSSTLGMLGVEVFATNTPDMLLVPRQPEHSEQPEQDLAIDMYRRFVEAVQNHELQDTGWEYLEPGLLAWQRLDRILGDGMLIWEEDPGQGTGRQGFDHSGVFLVAADPLFQPQVDLNTFPYLFAPGLSFLCGIILSLIAVILGGRFAELFRNYSQRAEELQAVERFGRDILLRIDLENETLSGALAWRESLGTETDRGQMNTVLAWSDFPAAEFVHRNRTFSSLATFLTALSLSRPKEVERAQVIFPGRKRQQEMVLFNAGSDPGTLLGLVSDQSREIALKESLKEVRERLWLILRSSRDGYFDWDLREGRLKLSPAMAQIRGLQRDVEQGTMRPGIKDLLSHIHNDDRARVWEEIELVMDGKKRSSVYQFRLRAPSGGLRWIQESISAVYSRSGGCQRILGLDQDITETRRREDELIQARLDAEESNRSKNEFLSSMSHEIRTPMNAILGFSELLLGEMPEGMQSQYVKTIQSSGRELMGMLDNILTLARIEAGKFPHVTEAFDPAACIHELVLRYSPAAGARGLSLQANTDQPMPPAVQADREQIMLIAGKILDNALEYTERGEVRIDCSFDFNDEMGKGSRGILRLRVDDSGIGMESAQMKELSGLFARGDSGVEGRYRGSGLGLTIAARLTAQLGGRISIEKRETGGTRAELTVPVELPIRSSGIESSSRGRNPVPGCVSSLTRGDLVVVDDSESHRQLVRGMLGELATEAQFLGSAEEFLELLPGLAPGILLLDLHLPGLSGWQLLDALEENAGEDQEKWAIVLMSGDDPLQHRFRPAYPGEDCFLAKPFNKQELFNALEAACIHKASTQEKLTQPVSTRTGNGEQLHAGTGDQDLVFSSALQQSFIRARSRMRMEDIRRFSAQLNRDAERDDRLLTRARQLDRAVQSFDIGEIGRILEELEEHIATGDSRHEQKNTGPETQGR